MNTQGRERHTFNLRETESFRLMGKSSGDKKPSRDRMKRDEDRPYRGQDRRSVKSVSRLEI